MLLISFDLTASLLTMICHEMTVESHLQPITGEQFTLDIDDGAGLDISANDFWGVRCEKHIDVKVFNNPHVPTNRTTSAICRKLELCKKCSYEAHICEVEQSSFTPSAMGGMAKEATMFYKCLASLLSAKGDSNYVLEMGWVRCC